MKKVKLPGGSVQRIRRLFVTEGYTLQELCIMYKEYDPRVVRKAIRGLTKAEQI